ncbi:MAG: hypothetical protein Kow00109_24210 [Acidobacteriota bacterium]
MQRLFAVGRRAALTALLGLLPLTAVAGGNQVVDPERAYYDGRRIPHRYEGPGREQPAGEATRLPILYFGPHDPTAASSDLALWLAARMAAEDLAGGAAPTGPRPEFTSVWSENPWGTGIARLVKAVYTEEVVAVLTGITGDAVHLAEQAAAKARIPIVNSGSTDETAHRAHVAWLFSCLPGETAQAAVLAAAYSQLVGERPFILLSSTAHDMRVFTDELLEAMAARGRSPRLHLQLEPGARELPAPLTAEILQESGAVFLVAEPELSAALYPKLRRRFPGPIFGSWAFGRTAFLEAWPGAPGPVFFPYPADPAGVQQFSRRFAERFGRPADYAAAQTYDAVVLLAAAARHGGANRARLADALREVVPWRGYAGTVKWDMTGQNTREPVLATLEDGGVIRPVTLETRR